MELIAIRTALKTNENVRMRTSIASACLLPSFFVAPATLCLFYLAASRARIRNSVRRFRTDVRRLDCLLLSKGYELCMKVIKRDELPFLGLSNEFVGKEHGVGNSIFFVTASPGQSVRLHRHDYDELILVQEGRATCTVDDEQYEVSAGDIIVIPAGHRRASPISVIRRSDRSTFMLTRNSSPNGYSGGSLISEL